LNLILDFETIFIGFISQSTLIVKKRRILSRWLKAGWAGWIHFETTSTVIKTTAAGAPAKSEKPLISQKNGGPWGYGPPDEEDIEVC
jgi:hypothetical protein